MEGWGKEVTCQRFIGCCMEKEMEVGKVERETSQESILNKVDNSDLGKDGQKLL